MLSVQHFAQRGQRMDLRTVEAVSRSQLMRGVSDPGKLLGCFGAKKGRYPKDAEIVGYGEDAAIAIITKGTAYAVNEDYSGNRNIASVIDEGGVYGVAFVYSDRTVTTRLVAATPCEAVLMNGGRLHKPCGESCTDHTIFLYNALAVVSNASVNFLEKIEHLSRRSLREKIMSYLTAQSIKCGCREFDIPFSRQELADWLAADRSALSAELSRMKADGLIDYNMRRFRMLHSAKH